MIGAIITGVLFIFKDGVGVALFVGGSESSNVEMNIEGELDEANNDGTDVG